MSQEPPEKMMFQLNLRRRGISDQAVLRAMEEVPREVFVDGRRSRSRLPRQRARIACGQTISQPFVVAYMTEQLQLQKDHRVLEIGTGSGYQAAVLSRLCGHVLTIERYRTLADSARARLEKLGYHNIEVMSATGSTCRPAPAISTASSSRRRWSRSRTSCSQRLVPGGILIAPVGPHHGTQTLVRVARTDGGFERKELVDVRFVPALPGIAREL